MACNHDRLCCTNNVFYCVICGAQVPSPFEAEQNTPAQEKPAEAPKRGGKRGGKKKEE